MISWTVTSMTSSFFQRTWKTMNAMYIWFWKSFGRLDFTPNWRIVNSINLKWNFWVTSSPEMAFTWILVKFGSLLIRLLQLLFKIFNVYLDLPIFINVSLPTIFQWPLLLGWLRRVNLFLGGLKLKMHFNFWRFLSQLPYSLFM